MSLLWAAKVWFFLFLPPEKNLNHDFRKINKIYRIIVQQIINR